MKREVSAFDMDVSDGWAAMNKMRHIPMNFNPDTYPDTFACDFYSQDPSQNGDAPLHPMILGFQVVPLLFLSVLLTSPSNDYSPSKAKRKLNKEFTR